MSLAITPRPESLGINGLHVECQLHDTWCAHQAGDQRRIATPSIASWFQRNDSVRTRELDRDATFLFPVDAVVVEVFVNRLDGFACVNRVRRLHGVSSFALSTIDCDQTRRTAFAIQSTSHIL